MKFSTEALPITVLRSRKPATRDEIESYLANYTEIIISGRPHSVICDLEGARLDFEQQGTSLVEAWYREYSKQMEACCLGIAVVSPLPFVGVALEQISKRANFTVPFTAETNFAAAVSWVVDSLEQSERIDSAKADWAANEVMRLYEAPATASVSSALSHSVEHTIKRLIALFSEPAYILSLEGEVLHRNLGASQLAGDPKWLKDICSASAGELPDNVRADLFPGDKGPVAAVVKLDPNENPQSRPVFASLSPKHYQLARIIAHGKTDKEAAETLDMPLSTVRTYVKRIYQRIGVRSRSELAALWRND